jgi:transcriptional regulator NrdR family protein
VSVDKLRCTVCGEVALVRIGRAVSVQNAEKIIRRRHCVSCGRQIFTVEQFTILSAEELAQVQERKK